MCDSKDYKALPSLRKTARKTKFQVLYLECNKVGDGSCNVQQNLLVHKDVDLIFLLEWRT